MASDLNKEDACQVTEEDTCHQDMSFQETTCKMVSTIQTAQTYAETEMTVPVSISGKEIMTANFSSTKIISVMVPRKKNVSSSKISSLNQIDTVKKTLQT
jgi:hypothetical protein